MTETREKHIDRMIDKRNVSIMKYEIQMLGNGLFSDFDEIIKKKRIKKIQEKKNE